MITRPKNEDEMECVLWDAFQDWEQASEDFAEEDVKLPDFEVQTIQEHRKYVSPEKGVVFIQGDTAFMITIQQIHFS